MTQAQSGNQLSNARSAYLRTASHQPVHWREWNDAAFERAQSDNKPILLDIGAVWCHWCHVMDGESYENEEIASLINENFIAVKVDRDERPDIDSRMQAAVQAISGQGGWPLTAFLTPDGKPFFAGTYFPPDERYGRPGFKQILQTLSEYFRRNPAEIIEQSDKVIAAIASVDNFVPKESQLSPHLLEGILNSLVHSFDVRHGGFGTAPKFPHSGAVELLLNHYHLTGEAWALTIADTTLTKMAQGGVYDQVGGGFHRYSTDEHWTVPHFEKMSYDNSELLKNYLHGYQATQSGLYREVAEGILSWVDTTLSDPANGGFYASQDADIDLHDDGDFFTWTLGELNAALPREEAEVMRFFYGVEQNGDMHHNPQKNVLERTMEPRDISSRLNLSLDRVHELLVSGKGRLLEERKKRKTPFVDTTLYTNWNAMMISAYLEAWKVLGLGRCRDFALKSLDRLLALAYKPEIGMYHSIVEGEARVPGLIEDQVHMANALLDAFEVTLNKHYFDLAEHLIQVALGQFWDPEHGGFFDTPREGGAVGTLASKRKPFQDSPTPAANPVAAIALERLYHLTGNTDYRDKAETILRIFSEPASRYGLYAATYGIALALYYQQPMQVLIFGEGDSAPTAALLKESNKSFRIGKVVLQLAKQQVNSNTLPPALLSLAKSMPLDSLPRAFVCSGFSCSPPVDSPAALAEVLSAPAGK
ncbi:MAG: thioredoxin domain-containing protein [Terriglobia bacterium]